MNRPKKVTVRDLVEEAKKRILILAICVVGLSYLMSLTSSSVLVNLPAAASLIILLRYFSLDYEMRRKAAVYNSKPAPTNTLAPKQPPECPKVFESDWRRKVNSPVVDDAIDHFTRHLISEWVADLWYSRLTPDMEGPEELVQIMNGVLGEFSDRMRNINLIDFLTRDLINLICLHLELFRINKAKIEKQQSEPLTIEHRDTEIRRVLAAENKLHPALFSAESEHKVLQHLMDGLVSFTFRPEDLQCSFFRYIVRELLACAVMRPVLNLVTPRFINERIESAVISMTKAKGGFNAAQDASQYKPNGSSKIPSDHFSKFPDPSVTGVELVQLKTDQSGAAGGTTATNNLNGTHLSKDPSLSMDTRSPHSRNSVHLNSQTGVEKGIERHRLGRKWGDMLDHISRRKTEVLAPENFENMWTKGRNYKKKEGEKRLFEQVPQHSSAGNPATVDHSKAISKTREKYPTKLSSSESRAAQSALIDQRKIEKSFPHEARNVSYSSSVASYQEDDEHDLVDLEEVESESNDSFTSEEEEETGNVTGIGSPGTKVWDGKSNRNLTVSHIHHPLEHLEGRMVKKAGGRHVQYQRLTRTPSSRKRSRLTSQKLPVWQEVERTSFLSGDGQDILNSPNGHGKADDSSDDSETEFFGRLHSGAAASSSAASIFISESRSLTSNSLQNSLVMDSFFKLRCEVLGANIVKSGSRTFAVYSISVTDVNNNNSWSIKRRFRHFEELHQRLKQFPEYKLHLPPKHFLSTGLDVPIIQERCKFLDGYLKKLLQLPTISGSIEVWDFLSVDSQTYVFSNSFSILETLSVDLDDNPSEKSKKGSNVMGPLMGPLSSSREQLDTRSKESALQMKPNLATDGLRNAKAVSYSPSKIPTKERGKSFEDSGSDSDTRMQNNSLVRNMEKNVKGRENYRMKDASELLLHAATHSTLPTEWVPPNLSVPILDLVDVIFQHQDGGWIRRKAFWVAKQILQLGMGDAFDDWLIEKIQLLRKGSVVASGIKRIEQILWPDGIFITKHPRRQHPPSSSSPSQASPRSSPEISSPRLSDEQQQLEAERRAKFVYELMIDNAPAAIVGLVGRRKYERCAKDLYFFIQSSVCLKLLAYDLLELLMLSAFPEMDYVFKQLEEEKHKFGEFKAN